MEIGGDAKLNNGLSVLVDWLSFTLIDSIEPSDAYELLGYSSADFHMMPKGQYGYKTSYKHLVHNIHVLCDGNDSMGVHVDISGSAVEDVLKHYHDKRCVATPFGGSAYECENMQSTVLSDLLKEIGVSGKVTRLDLAIDDIGAQYFSMDELETIFESGACSTRFKEYRQDKSKTFGCKVTGNTFYLGSRKSACMLRIYDKQLEQNAKLKKTKEPLIDTPWVRWELELKDERAISASNILSSGKSLGEVVIGIISNYIRFIELDNIRKSRCSTMQKWLFFIMGVASLKLYQRPEPKTIDDKKEWLMRQIAPSISAVVIADGGDVSFLYDLVENGRNRINRPTRAMIRAYNMKPIMRRREYMTSIL